MFQITHIATGKVIGEPCHTEKEAQAIATADKRSRLEKDKYGRRALGWLKYKLSWALVEKEYTITEMIGMWIDSDEGRLVPEETTDDNELLFMDKKKVPHLGLYDAEEGVFVTDAGDIFTPERVIAFFIIPDALHEN